MRVSIALEFFSADLSRDELANEGVVTDAVDYTESLVREILSASDDTAMIMLSTWAVPHPYINGAEKHNIVAEYYVGGLRSFGMETDEQAGCDRQDVTRLSSRAFLYKYYMQNQEQLSGHFNQEDFGHQSQEGHLYMAQLGAFFSVILGPTRPLKRFQSSTTSRRCCARWRLSFGIRLESKEVAFGRNTTHTEFQPSGSARDSVTRRLQRAGRYAGLPIFASPMALGVSLRVSTRVSGSSKCMTRAGGREYSRASSSFRQPSCGPC